MVISSRAIADTSEQTDRALLYVTRGLRGFGDGFAIILLPAYLSALEFTTGQIGMVVSASLLGTALLTLAVGFIAPQHDLRNLLLAGAALMAATGVAFPNVTLFAPVAIVAFIGTINPSTGDLGVLVPLEHAMLARGASDESRTRVFARYSLIGALSMAAGSLAAALPDLIVRAGIDTTVPSDSCSTSMARSALSPSSSTGDCHTQKATHRAPARRWGPRAA